ncbi:MAG: hypothetical protein ACJ790_18700 [Myxococcaceae bacterium]
MRRLLFAASLLLAAVVFAKPWHGLEPGVSTREDVIKNFGLPSKILVSKDGKETLGYFGPKAIKATSQAQFKIDNDKKIERIDVFPATPIKRETIVDGYGPECPEGVLPEEACFVKKKTDDNREYIHYVRIGVAVFFKADGSVQSMVFTPMKK